MTRNLMLFENCFKEDMFGFPQNEMILSIAQTKAYNEIVMFLGFRAEIMRFGW